MAFELPMSFGGGLGQAQINARKKKPPFGVGTAALEGIGNINPAVDLWGTDGQWGAQGVSGTGTSAMPSLAAILSGDPMYQQYIADLRAGGISDRAGLKEARQRALINFGEIPNFRSLTGGGAVGDLEADINEQVRSLANQSTQSGVSTVARIEDAKTQAARQLTGFLASRGLVRSGETGHQQQRQQTEYTRSRFDATQQLLDYLAGYQQSFTQAEQQRKLAAQSAAQMALQNYLSMNPNAGSSAGAPSAAPPGSQTQAPRPPSTNANVLGVPPGGQVIYNPQVGTYVVKDGKRIGRVMNGQFIPENPSPAPV